MRILVVEDDEMLGDGIVEGLRQHNYAVDLMRDGKMAELALDTEPYDAVVMDIGLPHKDGIAIVKSIRAKGNAVPVLLLTARDAIDDRVRGLDSGADDYLTKPFDLSELLARMRALVRRSVGRSEPKIKFEALELDPAAQTLTINGEFVKLSRREFALLECLLENIGKVVSKTKLLEKLYGWDEEVDSNTLEVHIHNLRKKIQNKYIKTLRGVGYIIQKPPQETLNG
ncbi:MULTISPECIES: response regulator [Cysteiniphilum]|uniref:DNA-binding response regulator n=1 Tax=Cysteiniphilum litorale TaxID=2056700 RepID=A0A8J3E8Z2_9GAMM|nr:MULTISPECIES: response regulator transcription factor [Cysteiniphilum]GGF97434.1 DNA-binding response regulator [Cysteiniphilum litorale]